MKKGFTLVELLVSISMFLVIMTISVGSIVGIFDANRKSKTLKTAITNLNLAVESMSKEMRFGTRYHCDSAGAGVTTPLSCPSFGGTYMSFLSSDNIQITYRRFGTAIEKQVGAGGYIEVTAPEIIIDNLTFYTRDAESPPDLLQPEVVIMIKSHAGTDKSRTDFTLETFVSQRVLDD
jgi:prepilin-type N-terminal cleavage/methylation domain-containing protein